MDSIEETKRSFLLDEFGKMFAVWYLFGKTDLFNNMLFSSYEHPHLVQLDHESNGHPLSDLTHPYGFDIERIKREYVGAEYLFKIIHPLQTFKLSFSSSKQEKMNPELFQCFEQHLRELVHTVKTHPNLQILIKIKVTQAPGFYWY